MLPCRWEACKAGHDDCIELLLKHGGRCVGGAGQCQGGWALGAGWRCAHHALSVQLAQQCARPMCLLPPGLPPCSLGKQGVDEASLLCTCVFSGELALLRRLMRAGADMDVGDYGASFAPRSTLQTCSCPPAQAGCALCPAVPPPSPPAVATHRTL